MKKVFLCYLLLFSFIFFTGCGMDNNPTSKVEDLFTKYQKVDDDIAEEINSVVDVENMSLAQKDRYKKIIEKQYKNLSYEIKEEIIDGNYATVVTEIEVLDYKRAIQDLTFNSEVDTKENYDENKLNRLENVSDKVTYTLQLGLTKDKNGDWNLNALSNETIKKIQGMY